MSCVLGAQANPAGISVIEGVIGRLKNVDQCKCIKCRASPDPCTAISPAPEALLPFASGGGEAPADPFEDYALEMRALCQAYL